MTGRLVLGSVSGRPRQLITIGAAVLVAALTTTAVAVFAGELQRRVAADLAAFGPNLVVRPQVGGPATLPLGELAAIAATPGVEGASAVREGRARLRFVPGVGALNVALDDDAAGVPVLAASAGLLALYPGWELEGRWPVSGEALLGAATAPPAVVATALAGAGGLRVSGRLSTGSELDRGVILPLPDPELAPTLAVDRIEVRAAPAALAAVRAALLARVAGADVEPVRRVSDTDRVFGGRLAALLAALAGLTVVLVILAVAAATTALVDERRGEIALMLALGLDPRRIGGLLAGELVAAALVAAVLGELGGLTAGASLAARVLGAGAVAAPSLAALAVAPVVALLVVGAAVALALRRIGGLDPARVLAGE